MISIVSKNTSLVVFASCLGAQIVSCFNRLLNVNQEQALEKAFYMVI